MHAYVHIVIMIHDEIFHFTGVERTNTEIDVYLFDNANDYRIKNNKLEKDQMTDR